MKCTTRQKRYWASRYAWHLAQVDSVALHGVCPRGLLEEFPKHTNLMKTPSSRGQAPASSALRPNLTSMSKMSLGAMGHPHCLCFNERTPLMLCRTEDSYTSTIGPPQRSRIKNDHMGLCCIIRKLEYDRMAPCWASTTHPLQQM